MSKSEYQSPQWVLAVIFLYISFALTMRSELAGLDAAGHVKLKITNDIPHVENHSEAFAILDYSLKVDSMFQVSSSTKASSPGRSGGPRPEEVNESSVEYHRAALEDQWTHMRDEIQAERVRIDAMERTLFAKEVALLDSRRKLLESWGSLLATFNSGALDSNSRQRRPALEFLHAKEQKLYGGEIQKERRLIHEALVDLHMKEEALVAREERYEILHCATGNKRADFELMNDSQIMSELHSHRNSLKFAEEYRSPGDADAATQDIVREANDLFAILSKDNGPKDKISEIQNFFAQLDASLEWPAKPEAQEQLPVLFFSDLETDDIYAIAAMWKRQAEKHGKPTLSTKPIIIYMTEFETKDKDPLAMPVKMLNTHAHLGLVPFIDYFIVTPEQLEASRVEMKPVRSFVLGQTEMALEEAAGIVKAAGTHTLFNMAPGRNMFARLHHYLGETTISRMFMYTGGVNVRDCTMGDWQALLKLIGSGAVYDVSRVPMFCFQDLGSDEKKMPFQGKDTNRFLPESFAHGMFERSPKFGAISLAYRLLFSSERITPKKPVLEHYQPPKGLTEEQLAQFSEEILASRASCDAKWEVSTVAGRTIVTASSLQAYSFALYKSCAYDYMHAFRQKILLSFAQGSDSVPITDVLMATFFLDVEDSGISPFKLERDVKGKFWYLRNCPHHSNYMNGATMTDMTKSAYECPTCPGRECEFVDTGLIASAAILKLDVCKSPSELDKLGKKAESYILGFLDDRRLKGP